MADAADLKSASLTGVWVQVPPSALTPFQGISVNKISCGFGHFSYWANYLKCLSQGSNIHFRGNLEVYMGLQFIILMAAITFVILFIITVMIVAIILFAVMGSDNK
jgi:hypothetical protein